MKSALVRAVRTGIQSLAAGLLTMPVVTAVTDINVSLGKAFVVVLYTAGFAFVLSFLQNVSEDKSGVAIPKG